MTLTTLRPRAVADLVAIREHYEEIEPGLSLRFAEALDQLFARLEAFPRSAPRVVGYEDVRRAVIRGFPYVVFYRHRPEQLDVLRVLHAARSDADQPPEPDLDDIP